MLQMPVREGILKMTGLVKLRRVRSGRLYAVLICLCVFITGLLTELNILRESAHDCRGDECRICEDIRLQKQTRPDRGLAPAAESGISLQNGIYETKAAVSEPDIEVQTLLTDGVRMDC